MMIEQAWPAGPISPNLRDNQVHVWSASLDVSPAHLSALHRILSEEEREKEKRLRFQWDKDRYVVSEAVLRAILGRYLGAPPASLRFVRNPHGKPTLAPELGTDLRFNMSHSQNLALYAITRGREVGVDVESVQTGPGETGPGAARISDEVPSGARQTDGRRIDGRRIDAMQIAEQFFSSYEVACLRQLPQGLQQRAFFHTWTRKEAYLKARGEGLTVPLNEFEVSVNPDEPAALLRAQGHPQEAQRWLLRALEPAAGFVATVVVERCVDAPLSVAPQGVEPCAVTWQLWSWGAW